METLKDVNGEFDGWRIGEREFRTSAGLAKFQACKFDFDCDDKGMTVVWFGSNSPVTIMSSGRRDWTWEKVPADR